MLPIHLNYPNFEANQVLASEHLNELFQYLDEQNRLTRTNLIGIGIVCGLEPSVNAAGDSIRISKGCGVSSEGYLIVWEDAAPLEWYRPYEVPDELPYREFEDRSQASPRAFGMWELTADRNNDPDAVRLTSDFLRGVNQPTDQDDEKILVLFLECLAESNRNCSPNSCNDKGTTVTATVRPLLIRRADMDLLQARVAGLGPEAAAYFTLTSTLSNRLGLPTLKLPRFDVAASSLGSSTSVFTAFQRSMSPPVVNSVAAALSGAYDAFQPLLSDFPANPFDNLASAWAFLHNGSIEQDNLYLWYQYYYDHLDTIIQAYDEFRLRGLEVIGLCCPESRLFPRHLMLANVGVSPLGYDYRHSFVPSPLFSSRGGALAELRLLFQRLVELVRGLELPPNVNPALGGGARANFGVGNNSVDILPGTFVGQNFTAFRPSNRTRIKITPSHLGKPLSLKAIPYHYRPLPLYQYWNYHLNRQGKADENLGYRSEAWNTTDLFVQYPLNYDLEPYNFLRIEGHVGQSFQVALADLLSQKAGNRLPIDIVALKTGYDGATIPLPENLEGCHFEDLQSLYAAFRQEMMCQICELVKHLYNLPYPPDSEGRTQVDQLPRLSLLRNCAPAFRYFTDTIGALYETRFNYILNTNTLVNQPVFDFNPSSFAFFFTLTNYVNFTTSAISLLRDLSIVLSEELTELDFESLRTRYQSVLDSFEPFNRNLIFDTNDADDDTSNNAPIDLEELSDQLDHFLYACKLETFQRIHEEYNRRIARIREHLLLSNFSRKHPGLQHKAGVPMGGTFVMVYHGENQQDDIPVQQGPFTLQGVVQADGEVLVGASVFVEGLAQGTVTDLDGRFSLRVDYLPVRLRVNYIGFSQRTILVVNAGTNLTFDLAIPPDDDSAVGRFGNLAVGIVIADFYLPYLCCGDCEGVQFVLPMPPPTFSWEQRGCTDPNGGGTIVLMPTGGTPPYEYSTNSGQSWQDISEEPINVGNGTQVQIRDAQGAQSMRRTVELRPPLLIRQVSEPACNSEGTAYTVRFELSGGLPPYTLQAGDSSQIVLAGEPAIVTFDSGEGGDVVVTDSNDSVCEASTTVKPHTCENLCGLPCQGITRELGYPFWLQRPADGELAYLEVDLGVRLMNIFTENGETIEINPEELTQILNPNGNLRRNNFTQIWNRALENANELIARVTEESLGIDQPLLRLSLDQDSLPGLSALRIEHFECHRFEFNLEVSYSSSANEGIRYRRNLVYSQLEFTVEERVTVNQSTRPVSRGVLPAFAPITRDRCRPEISPIEPCTEPVNVEGFTLDLQDDLRYILTAQVPDNFHLLWIMEHAIPAITSIPSVTAAFQPGVPTEVLLLVVDPDTNCPGLARETLTGQQRLG